MYKHVFGPVPSRRLGVSLGVDLVKPKSCNMNCIFCECGATPKLSTKRESFKDIKEVEEELKSVLKDIFSPFFCILHNIFSLILFYY